MLRKINLICVGSLKKTYLNNLEKSYSNNINVIEIKESEINKESQDIINTLKNIKDSYSILFDLNGDEPKNILDKVKRSYINNKNICFIIGGSNGVNSILKNYCDNRLKLSDFTYNHQIFRICSMIFIREFILK